MSDYTLVRKSRDGRQSDSDTIHCIATDSNETVCEELERKKLRAVRTLSIFTGESNLCPECSKKIENIN